MIHANQVLSRFREGLDTVAIAKLYGISEAHACRLLDEARHSEFRVNHTSVKSQQRAAFRGGRARQLTARKKPVTLAAVSILKG